MESAEEYEKLCHDSEKFAIKKKVVSLRQLSPLDGKY
jgi:hypothetical protein